MLLVGVWGACVRVPMSVCSPERGSIVLIKKGPATPHKALGFYLNQRPSFPLGYYLRLPRAISRQHEADPVQIVWINFVPVEILP